MSSTWFLEFICMKTIMRGCTSRQLEIYCFKLVVLIDVIGKMERTAFKFLIR